MRIGFKTEVTSSVAIWVRKAKIRAYAFDGRDFRRSSIVGRTILPTADVVWGHRWLAAKCQRYKYVLEILSIDLSRAFDTIRRKKLLDVCIHSCLVSETKITVRVNDALSAPFNSTVGTPQRHSLSPVLFVVYLKAAHRTLRGCLPSRPPADHNLPNPARQYTQTTPTSSHLTMTT